MLVVAELVFYAVGPGELPEGENERHERVPQDHARDALLPVAPVGDEDPLLDDAETAPPREAPDQLYIVELEVGIEAPALPEDLPPDRDAMPRARREGSLERSGEEVEERVEALYCRRGAIGDVLRTGDVEAAPLELREKAFEKPRGQAGVGVEEDEDITARTPASQVPPAGYGGLALQQLHEGELPRHRGGAVYRARVHDDHLIRCPGLRGHVGEQVADVALLVQGGDDDAEGAHLSAPANAILPAHQASQSAGVGQESGASSAFPVSGEDREARKPDGGARGQPRRQRAPLTPPGDAEVCITAAHFGFHRPVALPARSLKAYK
jgi:hypothetical protein